MFWPQKKGQYHNDGIVLFFKLVALIAAVAGGAAASALVFKNKTTGQFKPVITEIDFDGLGFFKKTFVNNVCKTINIQHIIRIFRLIQSHGQRRAASTTLIQENPDR